MRLAQGGPNPTDLTARMRLVLWFGLRTFRLCLRLDWLALHHKGNCADHGLILTISDVISHGLLHEVPSSLVPETNIVLDRPRTHRGERHGISDQGDRNQWARMLREAGLAGPGFVELPASNAAPFTEPNAD